MCTGITVWRLNFVFPLMISDGFVWDANRMVAELRLLRASDFERCKKVRNLLQKQENSEHFGKQHPFRYHSIFLCFINGFSEADFY